MFFNIWLDKLRNERLDFDYLSRSWDISFHHHFHVHPAPPPRKWYTSFSLVSKFATVWRWRLYLCVLLWLQTHETSPSWHGAKSLYLSDVIRCMSELAAQWSSSVSWLYPYIYRLLPLFRRTDLEIEAMFVALKANAPVTWLSWHQE